MSRKLGNLFLILLLLLSSCSVFVPSVAAEIPTETITSGLTFEDVNVTWIATGDSGWGGDEVDMVYLTNNYTNVTLTSHQLFIPDWITVDGSTLIQYRLEEWWGGEAARIQYNLQYSTTFDYGNPDLNALLGNEESSGGGEVLEWEYYPPQVTYYVGDIVNFEGTCYQATVTTYNICTPPNNPNNWDEIDCPEPGGETGSTYPANYFQTGSKEIQSYNRTEERGHVFYLDDLIDTNDDFDVFWKINVSSHYYHIIVNYELWFENSTTLDLVYSCQDVYSGEKPDLLPVSYQLNKYNDPEVGSVVDRAMMIYDNIYGDNHSINVTIAYPKGSDFVGFYPASTQTASQYASVVAYANDLGYTETLLGSTSDYTIKSYMVDVAEDSRLPISFKVKSQYGEFKHLSMWVTGSFAGGTGSSGDPYQISNWTQLANIKNNLSESFILLNNLNNTMDDYSSNAAPGANNVNGDGWLPLGRLDPFFTGTFDGDDYEIKDVYINRTSVDSIGLFGKVEGGLIQNVLLDNMTIKGNDNVGALVGVVAPSSTISNIVMNQGNITGDDGVGGIVGSLSGSTLWRAGGYGVVEGNAAVGGVVGIAVSSTMNESYMYGNTSGVSAVGGFIGNSESSWINNCFSHSDVFRVETMTEPNTQIGGFVGVNYQSNITNSYCGGTVQYEGASNQAIRQIRVLLVVWILAGVML